MSLQFEKDANLASRSRFPNEVFQIYDSLKDKFSNKPGWENLSEIQLWEELCLCILSSNVPFELAVSALKHLSKSGLLDEDWLKQNDSAENTLQLELSKPLYLPKKKDGSFRKYRFPRVRSRDIIGAANMLYSEGNNIQSLLLNSESHNDLRNYLASSVPGLGLKESSHFLRNIGFSSSLAIIDVHIISFLKYLEVFPFERTLITGKMYLELEKIMQNISEIYGLDLAILDNAIWYYMRSNTS